MAIKQTEQGLWIGLVVDEQPKPAEEPAKAEIVEEKPAKKPRKKKAE